MLFRNYLRHFGLNHCAYKRIGLGLVSNLNESAQTSNEVESSYEESDSLENPQPVKLSPKQKHINKINTFYNAYPHLTPFKNFLPASYLFQKPAMKDKLRIFLIDKEVACDIMKKLQAHLETYSGHVIEIGAGAGVLTEELLKTQLQNLRIYEPDSDLYDHLKKLIELHKSSARLIKADLQHLGNIIKSDALTNGDKMRMIFDGLPSLNWEDEPAVKVIGAMPNERFIAHIMLSITLQTGLCQLGRPELFLMFPADIYEKLTSNPSNQKNYRSNCVAFQVLFDHEELARLPEKAFVPWCANPRSKNKSKENKEASDNVCLVRITPKRDLLQRISPDLLRNFLYFVKFMMRKQSASLIDLMERWVPGCGVRLITRGYTIYTDCGSLTPDEYLEIFLEFTSWPEFSSSSFILSAESFLGGLLQNDLQEELFSDAKFSRLFHRETNVPEEEEEVFDNNANLELRDKSINTDIQGG
ncbi:dimethyladenosine transferase 2, mitochondrial [Macrosteles quadrilineatus]|uniref:dimethyladenosine transferase 2, mitochondrial n=1 Tax=Macrosteles quadrilineatus TaxID=74068 RepID=UPI0023E351A3|nr:dimethyladenosine transferase 2, mitochondrial [Macrosteles quadrilineatus]